MKVFAQEKTYRTGQALYDLITEMYPICRSITGDGLRESLHILQKYIPLDMYEIPSGTAVFDWTVPKEWNIKDAYIKNSKGERLIDFRNNNLHVLNYSIPVKGKFSLAALTPHLYYLPEQPELIPYKTSYYQETWGFCLSYNQFLSLEEDEYEVCIDSSLEPGHLSYGECYVKGELEEEVFVSSHICHPSLANDNLSGVAIAAFLAQQMRKKKPRYSYRFVFAPGTIGAITWLAKNEESLLHIKYGLIASLLGDSGSFTYKKSRQGNADIDRISSLVLKHSGFAHNLIDFFPYGYDERQYCSPGFNLPVGNLGRTPYGQFPEYHTSADNLSFISPKNLEESFQVYTAIIDCIENNKTYQNLFPKCEPQLGKRGLYEYINKSDNSKEFHLALLWVLNLSDGTHSLLDIAERSGISFSRVLEVADALVEKKLIMEYLIG